MAQAAQGLGLDPEVSFWGQEIDDYERMADKWLRRGRKIVKRYKDIRSPREEAITRFNVFWANVQIRMPALYARNPKAVVARRYKDKDPIGRVTSEVLERSIQYTLDVVNPMMLINRQAILDFELPGRGTTWIRYLPHLEHKPAKERDTDQADDRDTPAAQTLYATGPQLGGSTTEPGELRHDSADELAAMGPQLTDDADSEADEDELTHEETLVDYVSWEDFGHTWARTWDEVRAVWRRVFLDRDELMERFVGRDMLTEEEVRRIPLDWSPRDLRDAKVPTSRKKAIVYEIWDKHKRQVLWIHTKFPQPLDKRDDPENLKDFFPCPRPLYANLANDDLLPVPNFAHYQDQANEVDELSSRIASITKALKVAGVRDSSAEGLDRLLAEGIENQLIPVEGWAVLKDKGGLKGVFELLPMQEIAETLGFLREQRKELIDDIYQLTGISDIVRGLSDPNETATAQQLKGQFSILRIQDAQQEVQRFCRDQVHIIGEMVSKYQIDTLKAISGVKLLTNAEKLEIQAQQQAQARLAALQAAAVPPPGGVPGNAPPSGPPGSGPVAGPPVAGGGPPGMGGGQLHGPGAPPPGGAPGAPPASGGVPAGPPGANLSPGAPPMPGTPAPGQAPISPQKLELLEQPTWEEVEALLANPVIREFKLDIETDSTIRMDEEMERSQRTEFLEKATAFLTQLEQAGQLVPEIVPMLSEIFMWAARSFSVERGVEQSFEDALQALQKAAHQPRPNPAMAAEQAKIEGQKQIAANKANIEAQARAAEIQAEDRRNQQQAALEQQTEQAKIRMQEGLEQYKAHLKAATDEHLETLRMHFESQKVQFEQAGAERLEHIKHQLGARTDARQHAHERTMAAGDRRAQAAAGRPGGKPRNGGSARAAA